MILLKMLSRRHFSISSLQFVKVAVVGAAGGIGNPLSLLLRLSQHVTELSLYDIQPTVGIATDLSHIDRPFKISSASGEQSLKHSLGGIDIVVVSAGKPRTDPKWSRDDLFEANASIILKIAEACAKYCPKALIAIITNPVNSVVPVAAEALKLKQAFDPKRLFGVTSIDVVRAATLLANCRGLDPTALTVPVIGGHSVETTIPLISQVRPQLEFSQEEVESLTKRIIDAGGDVVKAKKFTGSSTLTTAYSAVKLIESFCRALKGEQNIIEYAYVSSDLSEATYFASPILLGKNGIEKILPLPKLSEYESCLLKKAIPILKNNIYKGESYVVSCKKILDK